MMMAMLLIKKVTMTNTSCYKISSKQIVHSVVWETNIVITSSGINIVCIFYTMFASSTLHLLISNLMYHISLISREIKRMSVRLLFADDLPGFSDWNVNSIQASLRNLRVRLHQYHALSRTQKMSCLVE
jgi:hypothetical protein